MTDEEIELGRELIAWAADEGNAQKQVETASGKVFVTCRFCHENLVYDGYKNWPHPDTCLHLRARALRDSNAD